jgi:peptidyl-prolyl cis-trans isomerase B (cyclophilin B)
LSAASLSDPSADVRARAAKALTRLLEVTQNRGSSVTPPALSAASFQALSASAKDSSAFVRENVAYYFSANSVAGATQTILTLSSDSDLWVRFFATKALGKINDPSVITKLGSLALDSNYIIRVTALQSLTALKAIGSLSPSTMTTLSQDPTFHVRGALAGGLGTLPSSSDLTQAKALLQTFVQDSSSTVRVDAWISLTELNGASELPSLQKALSSDPAWPARVGVVQALSLLGNAGEPLLLQAATDSDVHVRAIAMSALSAIPDAGAFNAIVKGLSSDQISERQSAVDAIAPRSESTVATELWNAYLRSANPTSTKWNGTREEAIGDLLGLPAASQPATPVLTAELEQVLKDPDTNLANFALQKLQALKVPGLPAAAIPALSFSPYRDLNVGNHPKVVLETTRGRVVIEFNTKMAPITVANFVGLSEAKRYDAIPFHRVVSGYIAQGGDPDGTGYGDAGYQMRQETGWATYRRGAVALARTSDVNSDSAQFFITTTPSPKLDSLYTIIGHVVEGMDVVDKLEQGDLINTARLLR